MDKGFEKKKRRMASKHMEWVEILCGTDNIMRERRVKFNRILKEGFVFHGSSVLLLEKTGSL
jgi:hypothetical protein